MGQIYIYKAKSYSNIAMEQLYVSLYIPFLFAIYRVTALTVHTLQMRPYDTENQSIVLQIST